MREAMEPLADRRMPEGQPRTVSVSEGQPDGSLLPTRPNYFYLKPNPFQIFLYLFFEPVALCEHSAKFGGQAGHFIGEGFVVFGFFFYANVAARVRM